MSTVEGSSGPSPDAGSRRDARLVPVDALRGLLMVLMSLDHAVYFVAHTHSPGEYWGGPFPAYERAAPFLARFATHFAAPGFFFLMGAGMALFAASRRARGWTRSAIARHLMTRGLVLIVLQFTLIALAWRLTPWGWTVRLYAGVLFALGATMWLSLPLLWLRTRWLLLASALLIVSCTLLTPSAAQWGRVFPAIEHLLMVPGGSEALWVNYPILPWLPLVLFGIAFGRWLREDARRAYHRALQVGGGALFAFVIVRAATARDWRSSTGILWIDLLNVVKYPPGVSFTGLTMGTNLALLGLMGLARDGWRPVMVPLTVFGGAPLLFYVLHLFLYAGLGRILAPHGATLTQMLPVWLLGLGILFPVCLVWGRAKRRASLGSSLRLL